MTAADTAATLRHFVDRLFGRPGRGGFAIALCGAVITSLALLSAIGWMLEMRSLVQPSDAFSPMRPLSTAAFALTGLATLAIAGRYDQRARALSIAAMTIALSGGVITIGNVALPFDDWMAARSSVMGIPPTRGLGLPMVAAISAYATALLLVTRRTVTRGEMLGTYGLGIVLLAGAGILAIVRVSELPLGALTLVMFGAGLQPMLAVALMGVALVLLVARTRSVPTSPPRWVPALATVSMATLVVVLWFVLRATHNGGVGTRPSALPDVVLVLGLALCALMGLVLHLLRTTWTQARVVESARLQEALESATDGVWEYDFTTDRGRRSNTQLRYLGYDPSRFEAGTLRWIDLVHPDDLQRVNSVIARNRSGADDRPDELSYRILAADGSYHTIVDRGRVVERTDDGAPKIMFGISADVTERQRADEAREQSDRRFRVIFESAQQFQALLDTDGAVLEVNAAALAMAGAQASAVVGRPMFDGPWWTSLVDARRALSERFTEARNGHVVRFEVETAFAGRRRGILDFSFTPLFDADGEVVQVLAEGRDVTERRRAEEALREIGALTTMGRLAARVAHEINNPLAGIQNSFLLLADAISPDHPHYRFVGAIEREIQRIAVVTRQLYETYRPDESPTARSSVVLAVTDAVSFLDQVNRNRAVRIVTDVSRAPSSIPIPDALVRQTLYNLVQNAVESSPPNGVVTVTAAHEGGSCVIVVRDEGPGIAPHLRDRIWDPFFSTKDSKMTTGMGLGLALVRQSVEAVGGSIRLIDSADPGATFEVRLPMTPVTAPPIDQRASVVS